MPNIISKYHQPRFVSSSLKREFSNPGKSKLINQQEFSRLNFIKINKNKLPKDFFPETAGSTGDSPAKRFDYANNEEELVTIRVRKTQSEKQHISPQKTSFFGFFEEEDKNYKKQISPQRKFSTRETKKRDPNLGGRKYTPFTFTDNNRLNELLPLNIKQSMIGSKSAALKLSPRKQYKKQKQGKNIIHLREMNYELFEIEDGDPLTPIVSSTNSSPRKGGKGQQIDFQNMTFFNNNRSSILPPINLANGSHSFSMSNNSRGLMSKN